MRQALLSHDDQIARLCKVFELKTKNSDSFNQKQRFILRINIDGSNSHRQWECMYILAMQYCRHHMRFSEREATMILEEELELITVPV
jgi:sulfite reductase beta subunit-like hemoprotein